MVGPDQVLPVFRVAGYRARRGGTTGVAGWAAFVDDGVLMVVTIGDYGTTWLSAVLTFPVRYIGHRDVTTLRVAVFGETAEVYQVLPVAPTVLGEAGTVRMFARTDGAPVLPRVVLDADPARSLAG